ncbi:Malate/lactate/ureidoglycolate dehydrogenase, LDH2 family [Paenibacillus sp. UNC496MF]|uniref:Ldh family oxidoreductase n=1 Tax=Paenibacillus sp. UNC496MF TaxID=1502753 RepID=UPI0008EEA713|nr:Ldh family oxidoreductase [Paenibacillus sp. UNC496MF]SFJ32465.1 Malate/lactate/ureidoglycolate dehydrogenase, LDH2 family [Paenibacillus sp. UNC496MF]
MNTDRREGMKVDKEKLKRLVREIAQKVGMPEEKAAFLAELLVKNDLRGIFSHGTVQIAAYARIMRDGLINPDPQCRIATESSATMLIDGDGGLGYFAAFRGAEALMDRCRKTGIAAAVTRNHGHIGAAGIYARLLAENDLIGYVTSGHQLSLRPEDSIMRAAGGSPMSFAVPGGAEGPMVLDFGAMHDLYEDSPHVSQLFDLAPGLVFRSMGLGFMCQALGGFLAGVPVEEERAARRYQGANQGSLIIALDPGSFLDIGVLKHEMAAYRKLTSNMRPMPGYDRATLPGVLESEREADFGTSGIPVDEHHKAVLSEAAAEYGVELPF